MFNTSRLNCVSMNGSSNLSPEGERTLGAMFNTAKFDGAQFNRLTQISPETPAGARAPVRIYRMILTSLDTIPFFLVHSSDHTTPAPGLNPEVFFSSAGQPFRVTNGDISEIGNGWYSITPLSEDILGISPLILFVPPVNSTIDPCTVRIEILPISGVVPLRVNMTRYPLTFYMTSSADHVTPAIDKSPDVSIRKAGGPFQEPVGSIQEIGNGWYMCSPDKADVDTVGPLILEATASGVDTTFEIYDVMGTIVTDEIDRYTLTLLMIRTMLINSGMFTEATCVISLDKMPFSTPSVPSLWINPGSTNFDPELEAGGSRYTLMTSPVFTLNILVRRMQDVEVHDKNWLTNASRGAYPVVWKIINFLAGKFVHSTTGDQLTTRTLRPLNIGNPYRYSSESMLAVVPVTFTTNVLIDVNIDYPYIAAN